MSRPPLPPFNEQTAIEKVRLAEDGWNTRDPAKVAMAYSVDTRWRNRAEFLNGRAEVEAFLTRKWNRELDYRLIKELWTFAGNRIAVRYAYEYHDDSGQWFRAYGNENWEFAGDGLMRARHCSINEQPIPEAARKFRWALGRPARRPSPTQSFWLLISHDDESDVIDFELDVRAPLAIGITARPITRRQEHDAHLND